MAGLTARDRRRVLVLGLLYAALVIPIGVHKGDDFVAELGQSRRLLAGAPLFAGIDTSHGLPWPPFSALALVPYALVAAWSLGLAKAAWAATGVLGLVWAALRLPDTSLGRLLCAVAAVGVPLETNFEYLNVGAVLLGLVAAGAADLRAGRDGRAGTWFGLATALKAFPGLLLLYLAYRRRWRALAAGVATAGVATLAALLRDGPGAVVPTLRAWLGLALAGGWLPHPGNQSLAALVGRLGGTPVAALGAALGVVALAAALLGRHAPPEAAADEVAIVLLLATVLSPIAWFHSYLLLLPAWAVALGRTLPRPLAARALLVAGGVLTSGVLTLGSYASKVALLDRSVFTLGALALLAVLLLERLPHPPPVPEPA